MAVWFLQLLLLLLFSLLHVHASISSLAAAPTSVGDNAAADRLSLLALKAGFAGGPAAVLSSWNDTLHFCRWEGVACGRRHPGRVTSLDLNSLGLVGYISPSIGNLTFLRAIDLSGNRLYGVIPPELGRLPRLQFLDLKANQLSGEIPDNLSRCSDLGAINLRNNQLVREIPGWLGSLPKLYGLNLNSNNLSGPVPPSLGNLSFTMKMLGLGLNRLSGGIPHELGRFVGLRTLELHGNHLSGTVPASLYNLTLVRYFLLHDNQLTGTVPSNVGSTLLSLRVFSVARNRLQGSIPSSFVNASSLQELDLSGNGFGGTIPNNLGVLQNLSYLNVGRNQLQAKVASEWGFLDSLANCTRLQELGIHGNELEGALPVSVANLSLGLERLVMGENRISGTIPSVISNLAGLILLSMEQNRFTGGIPASLGNLEDLGLLQLSGNRLSGEIPPTLGNLTRLSKLHLAQNDLQGRVPPTFGNLRHLQLLDLSQNNLIGTIPDELLGLSSLTQLLDLSYNSFAGSLPASAGRLTSLGSLYLSGNKLSGDVPGAVGNCVGLEHLFLDDNHLQGSIPPSLSNLKGIQELDLSSNNFSGRIPEFLVGFGSLEYLNLSFNNFEGEVTRDGVLANWSVVSLVGNKRLCGGVSRFRLPSCPVPQPRRERRSRGLHAVIIGVAVGGSVLVLLLCLLIGLYLLRRPRVGIPPTVSLIEVGHRKISYHEILKATDAFSPANLLGVGSFGSVYRGNLGDETVAVKVLNLSRRGASRSFLAECEALRSVRHRNLVKIITSCSSVDFEGRDFKALVFEYMQNGSLDRWLHPGEDAQGQTRTLGLVQRLNIAIDVASALDYLHHHCSPQIIHCDLKPSNVLLDQEVTARVGDFGLARILCGGEGRGTLNSTSSVVVKGTVGYVAPEYGLGGCVSVQGDTYSFGVLLLEMFTAKRPTDEMFKDGLSLRRLVEGALPEQVMDIADPLLSQAELEEEGDHGGVCSDITTSMGRIKECLVSVMEVGLACASESPRDRTEIGAVIRRIETIKDAYLGSQGGRAA